MTTTCEVKKRIRHLINQIRYYDYMYYVENQSVISDIDYDLLREQLEKLEEDYPQYKEEDSPTNRVGFFTKSDVINRKHNLPMLSLKNTYLLEDIIKFINGEDLWPVIIEPKIDGVSLSLHYMDSHLSYGLLRGNGEEGENIMEFIMYISSFAHIPMKLSSNITCEIRGELHINKKNFKLLNEYRQQKGEKVFQNSRNGTAGLIRNKNYDGELYKYMSFTAYSMLNDKSYFYTSQMHSLEELKNLGFTIPCYTPVDGTEVLKKAIHHMEEKVAAHQDMDGVVIKTNDLIKMAQLGNTNHHPLGAIAYKFTTNTKESMVEHIIWQNSRNGKLTPVGIINEITLENAKINRITLHNKKYMVDNKIGVGSILLIERVGSTVPQVKKVVKESMLIPTLETCPSCAHTIGEDKYNFVCTNVNCGARIIENLCYFCKIMNIKGLGEKSIRELVEYVKTPGELVDFICKVTHMKVAGWEKLRFNFLQNIKNISVVTLLVSLGVENLSHGGISSILASLKIDSFEKLLFFLENDGVDHLLHLNIPGIGINKLQCFINFIKANKGQLISIMGTLKINTSHEGY